MGLSKSVHLVEVLHRLNCLMCAMISMNTSMTRGWGWGGTPDTTLSPWPWLVLQSLFKIILHRCLLDTFCVDPESSALRVNCNLFWEGQFMVRRHFTIANRKVIYCRTIHRGLLVISAACPRNALLRWSSFYVKQWKNTLEKNKIVSHRYVRFLHFLCEGTKLGQIFLPL